MSEITLTERRCKSCGYPLDELVKQAKFGVVECPACHRVWTIERTTDPTAVSFLRMGEHELDNCDFQKAYNAFHKAYEYDKREPEAYFGMALAKYKVQYIKDSVNNRLQPICHQIWDKKFTEEKYYECAMRVATSKQKAEYERRAKEIEDVCQEFYKLQNAGVDYDCFICVKVTEEGGAGRTADYDLANDIYYHLKDKGFKPFFSERILRNLTGSAYEAHILYALYKSECMLVVCSNEDYLQTPWVKNEYTRFNAMIAGEDKESDAITIVFNGVPIERLPGREKRIQGIDLSKLDAMGRIEQFVYNHTPEARKRKAQEEERARREREEQLKYFEEQQRKFEEQQRQMQEQMRRLEEQKQNSAAAGAFGTGMTPQQLLAAMRQAEEEERKAQEEERQWQEFLKVCKVEDTTLVKYKGNGGAVVIPNRITKIGNSAFMNCHALTSVVIPDSVISIDDDAFSCTGLTSVAIPNSVEEIGDEAFSSCKLTSIVIPESVEEIGSGAFSGNAKLNSIKVDPNNKKYKSEGNCLIERDTNILIAGCNTSVIPNGIEEINESAFYGLEDLKSITIPNGVYLIGESAFSGCENLTSVTIPDSVGEIAAYAFANTGLRSVTIPQSVDIIGDEAFCGCKNLTSVTMPNWEEVIDEDEWEDHFGWNIFGNAFTYGVTATFDSDEMKARCNTDKIKFNYVDVEEEED